MSQVSIVESTLLVRDAHGEYQIASVEQVLMAARSVVDQRMARGTPLNHPDRVQEFLVAKLAGMEQEVFAMLLMDSRLRLIQYVELFRGTIDSAAVYPREVVRAVLQENAAAVIMAHNHPSGSTVPSMEDRLLTKRLSDALALIDVRTLDHVIVAGAQTTSMAALGMM